MVVLTIFGRCFIKKSVRDWDESMYPEVSCDHCDFNMNGYCAKGEDEFELVESTRLTNMHCISFDYKLDNNEDAYFLRLKLRRCM